VIEGVGTNVDDQLKTIRSSDFKAGKYDTDFLQNAFQGNGK
jgi:biotin carboxylase